MNFLDQMRKEQDTGTVFIHRLAKLGQPERPWKLKFSPSSLCYSFCPHQYALLGLGLAVGYSKIDAQTLRRMDNGTAMHTRYDNYVKVLDAAHKDTRYGDPENEYRLAERLLEHPSGIRGRYDAILESEKPDDDTLYVTDFKSIQQHGNQFSPGFNELVEPLENHRKQLIIYMGMIEDMYELDRPISGMLIYEGKSEQNVKEFKVPWTDNARQGYQELLRLIALVKEAVATEDLTKVPCLCKKADKCGNWDIDELRRLKDLGTPKRLKM